MVVTIKITEEEAPKIWEDLNHIVDLNEFIDTFDLNPETLGFLVSLKLLKQNGK